MTEPAIRHLHDKHQRFNGELGAWTICGIRWTGEPEGIVHDCRDCARLDHEDRQAQRMQCGSAARLVP